MIPDEEIEWVKMWWWYWPSLDSDKFCRIFWISTLYLIRFIRVIMRKHMLAFGMSTIILYIIYSILLYIILYIIYLNFTLTWFQIAFHFLFSREIFSQFGFVGFYWIRSLKRLIANSEICTRFRHRLSSRIYPVYVIKYLWDSFKQIANPLYNRNHYGPIMK